MSTHRQDTSTLYAYFDMEIGPPGYNFLTFLVLADIERERLNLDDIHVVIVPGSHEGFRGEDVEYPPHNKEWRVRNILLPACSLLRTVCHVTRCGTRDEARGFEICPKGGVFPVDYAVDTPRANHICSQINAACVAGVTIPRLEATTQARIYIRDWIANHSGGRKLLTVTLRESSYDIGRNSDLESWTKFVRSLDTSIYFPVILRDTEALARPRAPEFENLQVFPEPSLNLELRAALYEQAYLNLSINHGIEALLHFTKGTRYLIMLIRDRMYEGWEEFYTRVQGARPGQDERWASPFQHTYWGNDSLDEIRREFNAMVACIDGTDGEDATSPHLNVEPVQSRFDLAMGYLRVGQLEHASDLCRVMIDENPSDSRAYRLLGIVYNARNKPVEAAQIMLDALVRFGTDELLLNQLAAALHAIGRDDEAVRWYSEALAIEPNSVDAHKGLAEIHLSLGDATAAVLHYQTLIELNQNDVSSQIGLADAYRAINSNDDAIRLYHNLLIDDLSQTLIWVRLGETLSRAGRQDEALTCLSLIDEYMAGDDIPREKAMLFLDRLDTAGAIRVA